MSKILFIVNPVAGGRRGVRRWRAFEKTLLERSFQFDVGFTAGRGHALQLAASAVKSGVPSVVAFGGDGTLNEVLNGFMQVPGQFRSLVRLGFVPAGSSNDFLRSLGIPPAFSPDHCSERSPINLDVGKIECRNHDGKAIERYFLVNASMGVIPQALEFFNRQTRVNRILKRISLDLTVVASGLNAIVRHRICSYALRFDGKDWIERRLTNLALLRGIWFGGGMSYGAASKPDAGSFSVVGIDELSVVRRAMIMPLFYTGRVLSHPAVWKRASSEIDVKSEFPGVLEADGELVGFLPARFTIIPNALTIIVWGST